MGYTSNIKKSKDLLPNETAPHAWFVRGRIGSGKSIKTNWGNASALSRHYCASTLFFSNSLAPKAQMSAPPRPMSSRQKPVFRISWDVAPVAL